MCMWYEGAFAWPLSPWKKQYVSEASWNVMAHAQKPDFVFSAKRTSPFKSAGVRQFSRLLADEVCASVVVMLDTPCSELVWRVLATHSIHQFHLHFPSRASSCAITFQTQSVGALVIRKEKCMCSTILSSVVSEDLSYFSTLSHELHEFCFGGWGGGVYWT
jgi:hypothetical protein